MKTLAFIVTSGEGAPVEGAVVLVAYPNGTYLTGISSHNGNCQFSLYRIDQPIKVLAAATGYLPFKTTIEPTLEEPVPLRLEPSKDERRALLFTRSTGYIPGVEGRLNPHKDGYVYANNIAINVQLATPAVRFEIGKPLHLIDVFGVETTIGTYIANYPGGIIECGMQSNLARGQPLRVAESRLEDRAVIVRFVCSGSLLVNRQC